MTWPHRSKLHPPVFDNNATYSTIKYPKVTTYFCLHRYVNQIDKNILITLSCIKIKYPFVFLLKTETIVTTLPFSLCVYVHMSALLSFFLPSFLLHVLVLHVYTYECAWVTCVTASMPRFFSLSLLLVWCFALLATHTHTHMCLLARLQIVHSLSFVRSLKQQQVCVSEWVTEEWEEKSERARQGMASLLFRSLTMASIQLSDGRTDGRTREREIFNQSLSLSTFFSAFCLHTYSIFEWVHTYEQRQSVLACLLACVCTCSRTWVAEREGK